MKKIIYHLILAVVVLLGVFPKNLSAQSPDKISYQAVIRNSSNELVQSSTVSMRISIIQGSLFGASVYVETHSKSTNINGLVTLEIGSGTIVTGTLASIDWANGPYFIKTETDPTGGTNYTITGTTQLLSVPFALHAKTAESAKTATTADSVKNISLGLNDLNNVTAPTPTNGQVLGWNGVSWVPQSAGGGSSYTAGTGLNLTGTTFNAKADTAIWNANKLQGYNIAATPATNGQVLSFNGTTWTPTTPILGSSNWTLSGGNIYRNSGRVGINTTTPVYPLHINWSGTGGPNSETRALNVNVTAQNTNGSSLNHGIYSSMNTNTAPGRSIEGIATGTNLGIGIYGESNTLNDAYGVYGVSRSSSTDNTEKYGIYGLALGSATGGGTGTGDHIGVFGRSEGVGDNVFGLQGLSFGSTGVRNYGMYGESFGSGNFNAGAIGIGSAAGGTGINAGIIATTTTTPLGVTNYAGYFAGDVLVTGTFSNPSDQKLKTSIKPLGSALESIMMMQPVTYFHTPEMISKMKLSNAPQFGFIAQDVELIFPHLVKIEKMISHSNLTGSQSDSSSTSTELIEFKSINYIGLIPILTKAIQEQQEQIKALEERLKALENR